MADIERIADEAEVIICGFALSRCEEGVRVFNLNNGHGAAVLKEDGTLIETNMDEIQLALAVKYMKQGLRYMGAEHAEVLSV